MFKTIKTAEQLQAEKDQAAKKQRIAELKRLLAESDFKVLPDYDNPDTKLISDRQAWRKEVRQLEAL